MQKRIDELKQKITKLENILMMLGLNGLAYTQVWHGKVTEKLRLQEELAALICAVSTGRKGK